MARAKTLHGHHTCPENGRKDASVSLVEDTEDGGRALEIVAAPSQEMLVSSLVALSALGLNVCHTQVRWNGRRIVQRIHVREQDDAPPTPRRMLHALRVLVDAFMDPAPPVAPVVVPMPAAAMEVREEVPALASASFRLRVGT